MHRARGVAVGFFLIAFAQLACAFLTPTEAVAPARATVTAAPSATASAAPTAVDSVGPTAEPSREASAPPNTATLAATVTITPFPLSPSPAALKLEIVQVQAWTDRQGNARVNVLFHNPYDFPVALSFRGQAALRNGAGKIYRTGGLLFLDGITGGGGFLLSGESAAANSCFTCEEALLAEPWKSVEFTAPIEDGSGKWNYSTEVEANVPSVAFDGDSPIFNISGTVKNNSDAALSRIAARVLVYDQDGNLVGAAEASADNVAAGASATVRGYGIGQAPAGPIHSEVTALGVIY
ncbi:MAG: FxLYD domain-containing protein [Anaerolineales bacterium]